MTESQLWQKLSGVSYAAVFRHKKATPAQCSLACQWALLQAQMHKPYDYSSAARTGAPKYTTVGQLIVLYDETEAMFNKEGEDASFMCSELVFRAFEIARAPLIKKPAHRMSPGMLFRTNRLRPVGRLA